MRKNKKLINLRYLFFAFISAIITILISTNLFVFFNNKNYLMFGILLSVLIVFCLVLACAAMTLINKEKLQNKSVNNRIYVACLFALAFIIISNISVGVNFISYSLMPTYSNEVVVCATVGSEIKEYDNSVNFESVNLSVISGGVKQTLNKNAIINVYSMNGKTLCVGDVLVFNCTLNAQPFTLKNFVSFGNGVGYKTSVNFSEAVVVSGKAKPTDYFKSYVKELLNNNLNAENAGIAYSVLFGDKSSLSNDIRNAFSYSGLAHVLAVSGLHVGFLLALINFFLKKLKVNKKHSFIIATAILSLYAYLCGLGSSVVRATIMSVVLMASKLLSKKYDAINSLSLSGLIILTFKPSELFNVGFQLSFICVYAIITLAPHLNKMLTKIKIPKIIAAPVSITVSTSIALVPIMAINFNQISLVNIISNIIVLPVFSLAYSVLFVSTIVVLLLPFTKFIFVISDVMFNVIKHMANFFANLPYSYVTVFRISYWALFAILLFALIFKFVMINKNVKAVLLSCVMAIFVVLVGFGFYSENFNKNSVNIFSENGNSAVVVTNNLNNNTLILNNYYNATGIKTFLLNKRISHIENLIVVNAKINNTENIKFLVNLFNIKNVVLENAFMFKIDNANLVEFNNIDNINLNFNMQIVRIGGTVSPVGYIITKNNESIIIPNSYVSSSGITTLLSNASGNTTFVNFECDNSLLNYLTTEKVINFSANLNDSDLFEIENYNYFAELAI